MPRPNVEAERHDQILAAACRVVAERGISSLRMSDVAQEAGVSSGTVHYYFDTKSAVLSAAFEHNFRHSLERRRSLLDSPDDPLTQLLRLVESYLPTKGETLVAWRVWAELWVEGIHQQELQEINDGLYAEWRALVVGLLRTAQKSGLVRDGDPVRLGNMLISMIDGLAMQVLVGSTALGPARARATLRAFIRDLLATPAWTPPRPGRRRQPRSRPGRARAAEEPAHGS